MENPGLELVSHPDIVPIRGGVVVDHQTLDLLASEMSPTALWRTDLLVTYVVLVLARRNELRIYPAVEELVGRQYSDFLHMRISLELTNIAFFEDNRLFD